jgi:hypothetical protein
MKQILIIQDIDQLKKLKNRTIVVETDAIEKIEPIANAVQINNFLFCVKVHVNQDITEIPFTEELPKIPLVFYPTGLGDIKKLSSLLPILKKLNIKFFLDCEKKQNYEAIETLSSLGIGSGIIINENADWEKLIRLVYFALCSKEPHASIEPFQYLSDIYDKNTFIDYGTVFFNDRNVFKYLDKNKQVIKSWDQFFYETRSCASCAGWRICLGKYAGLKDKTGCKKFTIEMLKLIESIKIK